MGDNGWNLIYIDNGKDIHSPIYSMIVLVVGAFAILFLACITAIIYTYKNTKKDNRKILSLAEQDQLTGMDNLSKFQWETQRLLAQDTGYCVAALNFRHFQYINDIFGKDQADELLVKTPAEEGGAMLPGKAGSVLSAARRDGGRTDQGAAAWDHGADQRPGCEFS